MSPSEVVDRQIETYNARDAARFAATYAEDAHVFLMPNLKLAVRGRSALQAHYAANVFVKEGLRAEVVARMVLGNKVVDHEVSRRIRGSRESHSSGVVLLAERALPSAQ
jgi:hypothetical protein